jgi:hypothetical protein
VTALCITGAAKVTLLTVHAFTLAWTHSIEKTEWQEDYLVRNGALVLQSARVKGSGAGMEVPEGAALRHGWWEYRPALPPLPRLLLAHSGYTADWRICLPQGCVSLGSLLVAPQVSGPVELFPCERNAPH